MGMVQGTGRLLSHLVAAAAVGAVACATGALTASASTSSLSLDPNRGPGGTTVSASGSGWCASPCGPVAIAFAGETLATVVPRADGTFQTTFQVPGGAQGGPNFVTASQQTAQSPPQTNRAFAAFTVTPSQPAPATSAGQPAQTAPATPSARSGGASPAPTGSGSPAASATPGSTPTGAGNPAGAIGDGPARSGPGGVPVALIAALSVAAILVAGGTAVAVRRRRRAGR